MINIGTYVLSGTKFIVLNVTYATNITVGLNF